MSTLTQMETALTRARAEVTQKRTLIEALVKEFDKMKEVFRKLINLEKKKKEPKDEDKVRIGF